MIGNQVSARCFVSAVSDRLVIQIDDQRPQPQPIKLTISMWRAPVVKTGQHTAAYQFSHSRDVATVEQRFDDGTYHCRSAVAAWLQDGLIQTGDASNRRRVIVAPAKKGERIIVVSTAGERSRRNDLKRVAQSLLQKDAHSFQLLRGPHQLWWHRFWSRSTFTHLQGSQHVASFFERLRTLHLYYMASTSRGDLPTKWNGLLFTTAGDKRQWGAQYWVWTTQSMYHPLLAADCLDLCDPFFNMYRRQLPDALQAGPQRWGVKEGAHFPETTPFDGPRVFPRALAKKFHDILYGRLDNTKLTKQERLICSYESAANQVALYKGARGHISHMTSSGSEIAMHAWRRYRYSSDKEWLRTHAYPLLRGTVDFYRNFVKTGQDGRYHVENTHAHEAFWMVKDSIMDLAAIRGTAPLAIRSAQLLGVDSAKQGRWRDLVEKLAPYPRGHQSAARDLDPAIDRGAWAAGYLGRAKGRHHTGGINCAPIFPFEDWTAERREPVLSKIARTTVETNKYLPRIMQGQAMGTTSYSHRASALVRRGEHLPDILASCFSALGPIQANGMASFSGSQAHDIENMGVLTHVLQESLLQSLSPRPGEPEILRVFPAIPQSWNGSFRLLARGAFLVAASRRGGKVEFIEIVSRRGEPCRVGNPWGSSCDLHVFDRTARNTRRLSGGIVQFATQAGGMYRLTPVGQQAKAVIISPRKPSSFSYTHKLKNDRVVKASLGMKANP